MVDRIRSGVEQEPEWMRDWDPQYKAEWHTGYNAQSGGEDYSLCKTQGWKDGFAAAQEDNS